MASIALCPKCSQHVALPDRASGEAEVRCPLCQAEYRLAEAQTIEVPPLEWIGGPVIPDVSPEHIDVSNAIASGESGIELAMPDELALSDEMATDDAIHALADDQSAEPTEHDTQRFALDPATSEHVSEDSPAETLENLDDSSISPMPRAIPADDLDFHEFHSQDEAPSAELDADAFSAVDEHAVDEHHDEIGHGLLGHELAEHDAHDSAEHELAEHDVSDHGAPEHGDSVHSAIDGESATATATARRPQVQKTRRKTGPIKQMIGIVVFGIMGIGLGYGILKLVKPKAEIIMSIDAQVATWWNSAKSMIGKGSEPTSAPNTVAKQNPPAAPNPPTPSPAPLTPPPIALQPPVTAPPVTAPPLAPVVATPPPAPVEPPPAPAESLTAHPIPAAQLEAALAGARSAMTAAQDTIKPNVFFALCDLGHAVALVENPQIPPARALKQTAASVLRAAAKPENRELLGTYSHQWLFSGKRPADKTGVLLVGRVEDMGTTPTRVGELASARIVVIGKSEQTPITVLTRDKPTYHVGDTVAILGSIVDDPAKSLPWYTGTEPKLVLSGLSQRLGDK